MNSIQLIPKEIQNVIPKYDGDDKLLNLFISKCEYVIRTFIHDNNPAQQIYIYHTITSRLAGKAAILVSERDNISTWEDLRALLVQHFGDPRTEACIAIELESAKIKSGESYIDFCHRLQNIRSSLISKVNLLGDEGIKAAKQIIYNNSALNVFMYNLPEDLIRFVRLNRCTSLESALSIVTEETNFLARYNARKQTNSKPSSTGSSNNNNQPSQFKFGINNNNNNPMKFGQQKFTQPLSLVKTPQGFRFGMNPQNKFNTNKPQQQPRTMNNYKQSGFFKQNPNQQFRFGIPNQQPNQGTVLPKQPTNNNDVSMRTVRNNMLVQPTYYMPMDEFHIELEDGTQIPYYDLTQFDVEDLNVLYQQEQTEEFNTTEVTPHVTNIDENFHIEASKTEQQK